MAKLEKLDKVQEALLSVVREDWINFTLYSGDELDREKAKEGIEWIYSLSKLSKPFILFVDSPLGAQLAVEYYKQILKRLNKPAEFAIVRAQVGAQVGDQVWDQVWDQVGAQVRAQVWDQVGAQVGAQVRAQVRAQGLEFQSFAYSDLAFSSYWVAWLDFFKKIQTEADYKLFNRYEAYLRSGSFMTIMLDGLAVVCRRPMKTFRDEQHRLHSTEKPAIEWRDGYKLYSIHGVRFDEALWQEVVSGKMTFKQIMGMRNIDQRMIALKLMDAEALLKGAEAKLLDASERGNELYLIDNLFSIPAYFLKYVDPSTGRVYISGIDPAIGKKGKADECMSWKFNIQPIEYATLAAES